MMLSCLYNLFRLPYYNIYFDDETGIRQALFPLNFLGCTSVMYRLFLGN